MDGGLVELIILHQQGVAAGGGAQPATGGGAGSGAGAEGTWTTVTVGERVQQGEVEAFSVPPSSTSHVPVVGDVGCRVVFRGDGGDLDAGTFHHTRL